jgi:hypothetical protein
VKKLAVLTVVWCCVACSAHESDVTVYVDPPPDGSACIGVVGFEIEMNGARGHWASGPLFTMLPVLDTAACRVPSSFSVSGVADDAAISVSVAGYDSARVPRVLGTQELSSFSGPPVHVPLAGIAGALPTTVLLINRGLLLGGAALADVTRMVVQTQTRPQKVLDVDAETSPIAPYFSATDPGAFAVDAVPDTSLTIDFTLRQGTVPRARVTATQNGSYWQAQ